MTLESKKCPKCKLVVPKSMYSKSQYRVNAYCKPCMAKYNKQRNKIREQRKKGGWYF